MKRIRFFFRKLKLFALSKDKLFSGAEVADILLKFDKDALWDHRVRRELLFMLASRRDDFGARNRAALVDQLLAGPDRKAHWSEEEFREFRDLRAAENVRWLEFKGFDLLQRQSRRLPELVSDIRDWSDERVNSIVKLHGIESVDPEEREDLANVPVLELVTAHQGSPRSARGPRLEHGEWAFRELGYFFSKQGFRSAFAHGGAGRVS